MYEDSYSGGYMLLRYFAKQVAYSFSEANASAMLAGDFSDSSASLLADSDSELTSGLLVDAMLTPLSTSVENRFLNDTGSASLYPENRNYFG